MDNIGTRLISETAVPSKMKLLRKYIYCASIANTIVVLGVYPLTEITILDDANIRIDIFVVSALFVELSICSLLAMVLYNAILYNAIPRKSFNNINIMINIMSWVVFMMYCINLTYPSLYNSIIIVVIQRTIVYAMLILYITLATTYDIYKN